MTMDPSRHPAADAAGADAPHRATTPVESIPGAAAPGIGSDARAVARRTVGVLGGMGPAATVAFLQRLVDLTPVERDQDHLHVIVDSNPAVPDRNRAVAGTGPSPAPILSEMARRLEAAGAELLVMPCNAAHAFAEAVTRATDVPFLSILDATVAEVRRRHPDVSAVGVLAAAGALDAHLYRDAFARVGLRAIEPEGPARKAFMSLLYRIKRGDRGGRVRAEMAGLAMQLVAAGAGAIVAGCTEVPLVLAQDDVDVPLVDSIDALAAATVRAAGGAPANGRTSASGGSM